jgi:CHAD domain-containing protein
VRDTGFQVTLLQMLARLHGVPDRLPTLPSAAARAAVARRLEALHRRVARAARAFESLPVEAQHRARKRLKRLRYLAELVAPLWPAAPVRRYLARLVPAQRALGLHNDVATAAAAFRAAASEDPPAWFAAGWLQAHGAVTARAAGQALRRVRRARTFWRG